MVVFFIEGYLNSLKLPNDVVLLNTSEIIQSDVIFNNTVNATRGLNVSGDFNGRKLEDFLEERVTLNASESLTSSLIFNENSDLRGEKNCSSVYDYHFLCYIDML